MEHKLLQTETEYRNWAWGIYQHWLNHENGDFVSSSLDVARELGLSPVFECWDTILDETGVTYKKDMLAFFTEIVNNLDFPL